MTAVAHRNHESSDTISPIQRWFKAYFELRFRKSARGYFFLFFYDENEEASFGRIRRLLRVIFELYGGRQHLQLGVISSSLGGISIFFIFLLPPSPPSPLALVFPRG